MQERYTKYRKFFMEDKKKILVKIGKYTLLLSAILVTLFIILMTVIAEEVKIGSNHCGVYVKRQEFDDLVLNPSKSQGYYNPTDCMLCLGKLVAKSETENFTSYNCVGIKFEDMFE